MKMKRIKPGIKAESFDILQYFYRSAHEPIIHAVIRFGAELDDQIFMQALNCSLEDTPQMRSGFSEGFFRARWIMQNIEAQDILTLVCEENDAQEQINRLLCTPIDFENGPQIKLFLIRSSDRKDSLCVICSHLVCDGAGLKEWLSLLAGHYSELRGMQRSSYSKPNVQRGLKQITDRLTSSERRAVMRSKSPQLRQGEMTLPHFSASRTNPLILTETIGREEVQAIHRCAKQHGATLNDVLLCAYARLLSELTGSAHISFPCPVDLRKHLRKGEAHGICNLTSNYYLSLNMEDTKPFAEVLAEVMKQMNRQKARKDELKPLMQFDRLCRAVPFFLLKRIVPKFFSVPRISYTNLGIIEKDKICFGKIVPISVFMTGAVKRAQNFQISVSSFDGAMTLSSNRYAAESDEQFLRNALHVMRKDLIDSCNVSNHIV
ncbi:MAG: condensation domain-containing protein [Anaerofustis sp.]